MLRTDSTHAVGKWHLGYCDERFTPTFRGFDSYLGYLNGAEEYFAHTRSSGPPHNWNFLDFRNGSKPNVLAEATNASWGLYSPFGNPPPNPPLDLAVHHPDSRGWVSVSVFSREVSRIARQHDATVPLFVYMPFRKHSDAFPIRWHCTCR